MHPKVALTIKKEIKNLSCCQFYIIIDYFPWICNIMPIAKPNGKIRYCTNFKNINEACPKDIFYFPNIGMIIDSIVGHEILSFMDGLLGYNKLRINNEDQHKIIFVTSWGIFYQVVMSFSLKNACETYERTMMSMFHDMIYDNIEVYVDDILANSRTKYAYILGFRKIL